MHIFQDVAIEVEVACDEEKFAKCFFVFLHVPTHSR